MLSQVPGQPGVVVDTGMCVRFLRGNREISRLTVWQQPPVRVGEPSTNSPDDIVMQMRERAQVARPGGYLPKPFNDEMLLRALTALGKLPGMWSRAVFLGGVF